MQRRCALGRLLILAAWSVAAAAPAAATVYLVLPDGGGDLPNLAEAIEIAISGDVIELGDGIYEPHGNRDLDFGGKALSIRSQSGNPEYCIIDVEGRVDDPHRFISFRNGESVQSILSGITIRGAWLPDGGAETRGGAVYCEGSSPRIERCVIADNRASRGGGVYCFAASPVLRGCVISGNFASWTGGGLALENDSAAIIEDCRFEGNVAAYGGGLVCLDSSPVIGGCVFARNIGNERGGGVYAGFSARPSLSRCSFVDNGAPWGSGIGALLNAWLDIERCIIAFGDAGAAVELENASSARLRCTDIYGNAVGDWLGPLAPQLGKDGNIAADPRFCGQADGDYSLRGDSPCSDAVSACGRMGALPVGCDAAAPRSVASSWSAVKSLYRSGS